VHDLRPIGKADHRRCSTVALGSVTWNGERVNKSVGLLSSSAALAVGMLTTGLLPQAVAMADTRPADTVQSFGDEFKLPDNFTEALSFCRPASLTGQATVECSVASDGESSDGSEDSDA
jgi:hypothetical protein